MKNFRGHGPHNLTLSGTGTSGSGVLVGTLFAVAGDDWANGDVVPCHSWGEFVLPKLSSDSPTQGANLYWDDTNKRLTVSSSGNTLVGWYLAAGTTTATCIALIFPRV